MTTLTYCRALLTPKEELNPLCLTPFIMFLYDYSAIFRQAEIETIQALQGNEQWERSKWNTHLQQTYKINKRQANGIIASAKGRLDSSLECRKNHLKQLYGKLKSVKKWIKTTQSKISSAKKFYAKPNWKNSKSSCLLPAACYLDSGKTHLQGLRFRLHQKQRYKAHLERKIEAYKTSSIQVKVPQNNVLVVGSKDEKFGNQNVQWDGEKLRFTVPYCLINKHGKYVTTTFPQFEGKTNRMPFYGAKTWHFYLKEGKWVAAVSFTPVKVPRVSLDVREGVIAIDDNPSALGWVHLDPDGNLTHHGQIPLLQGLPRGKHQAQLVEACLQLCYLAMAFKCPIVKEDLDFEGKKERLRESGQKYARMLSGWAYNRFDELLSCILANRGIELIRVNPAYTSVMGMVKYARQYGLSSSEASAIAIGRRGMRLSERLPDSINALLDVKSDKHVWSLWNQLNKLIRSAGISRHEFYYISSLTEKLRPSPQGKHKRT